MITKEVYELALAVIGEYEIQQEELKNIGRITIKQFYNELLNGRFYSSLFSNKLISGLKYYLEYIEKGELYCIRNRYPFYKYIDEFTDRDYRYLYHVGKATWDYFMEIRKVHGNKKV